MSINRPNPGDLVMFNGVRSVVLEVGPTPCSLEAEEILLIDEESLKKEINYTNHVSYGNIAPKCKSVEANTTAANFELIESKKYIICPKKYYCISQKVN